MEKESRDLAQSAPKKSDLEPSAANSRTGSTSSFQRAISASSSNSRLYFSPQSSPTNTDGNGNEPSEPSSTSSSSSTSCSSSSTATGGGGGGVDGDSSSDTGDDGESRGLLDKVALDKPTQALAAPVLTATDQRRATLAVEQAFHKLSSPSRRGTVRPAGGDNSSIEASYGSNQGPIGTAPHQQRSHRSKKDLERSEKQRSLFMALSSAKYSSTSESSDSPSERNASRFNFSYRRQSMVTMSHKSVVKSLKKKRSSKKLTLFALSMVNLTAYLTMSIIAPFFPFEASQKGMSPTLSGLVFSVYALVIMIASPLLGKLIPYVGVKFMLISGIWLAGGSNILFGICGLIEDSTSFIVFSFVIRSVGAFGAASFSTASYTYIIQLFPENVGLAFGLTETCVGIGMSLGPAVGGLLYGLGGYGLPFYVLGGFVLLNIPVCWFLVKPIEG